MGETSGVVDRGMADNMPLIAGIEGHFGVTSMWRHPSIPSVDCSDDIPAKSALSTTASPSSPIQAIQ